MMASQFYKQSWKRHKILMLSLHLMVGSLFFTNFIIGNKPVLCKYKAEWHTFIFESKIKNGSLLLSDLSAEAKFDYHRLTYDFVIWPFLQIDPKAMEAQSAWLPPCSTNKNGDSYFIGSYDLGRDVLAGCIYGLHKSLLLALLTIFISGILGIVIGSVFTFQSQRFEKISIVSIVFFILFIFLLLYSIILFASWKSMSLTQWIFLIIMQILCIVVVFYFIDKTPQRTFRMDFFGLRYIEIMKSIPVILILLILLQIIKSPDVFSLSGLISLVYIPIIAKYARAFTLSASNETYINAIIAIGQTGTMIYIQHILPKVLSQIVPILAFGVANIILVEASLSFLGLGIALDEISLGTMMHSARTFPSAWWVVIFPGLLVFWLVTTFNSCGELWSDRKLIREIQA